jgi:hypothetical protein
MSEGVTCHSDPIAECNDPIAECNGVAGNPAHAFGDFGPFGGKSAKK